MRMKLFRGSVVLLAGSLIMPLWAFDQPEEERQEIARADTSSSSVETSAASSPAPATMADTIDAMKRQIEIQQKQIEKLQSSLEQQQMELKAMNASVAMDTADPVAVPQQHIFH